MEQDRFDAAATPGEREFEALIAEFLERIGVAAEPGAAAWGLAFDADSHAARVLAHPLDATRLCLEVDVMTLNDAEIADLPELLLQLHQINHASRFEPEPWFITIDPGHTVMLHREATIAGTRPADLEHALTAAIARAKDLLLFWNWGATRAAEAAQPSAPGPLPGMIMG
jgi:hypothetical protein